MGPYLSRWSILLLGFGATACAASSPDSEPVGSESSAVTIGGLFATGINAAGAPLASGSIDPHYAMTSTDPARPGPAAIVVNAAAGWTGNTAASKWIAPQLNANGANQVYTYSTTFNLAGVDPATASITGSWACDDTCVMSLNGTTVAQRTGANAWTTFANFTVAVGSPFVLGANVLSVAVTNSGGGATGLQISTITGSAGQCTLDSQCTGAQFCDTGAQICVAKVVNGSPVPTVPAHGPPLTGVCTAPAAAAACVSGVCDTKDNDCGLANGDAPCTTANGSTVCRSTACSVNGTCEPAGGCNVDADCDATMYCDSPTSLCTPKKPNGTPVPTVPGHAPPLDGTCSAAEGTAGCLSGVCDTNDNDCGFANGDGPCTAAIGASVCRSTVCATTGTQAGTCVECVLGSSCPIAKPVCSPTTNTCVVCAEDSDCGGTTSGLVCDDSQKVCESGCRGTGGNGCPVGSMCSSKDGTIGTCTPTASNGVGGAASSVGGAGGAATGVGGAVGTGVGGAVGTGVGGAVGTGVGGAVGTGVGGAGGMASNASGGGMGGANQGGAGGLAPSASGAGAGGAGQGGAAQSGTGGSGGKGATTASGTAGVGGASQGGSGGTKFDSNNVDNGVVVLGSGCACRMDGSSDTSPPLPVLTAAGITALWIARRRRGLAAAV